ncbi:sensor domain-containing diguanylate cyclase [Ferribacterium limneticum]|uniref:sensor domain-containing diguanylate cyclase n=1 Tax=Ferribacterium limneticum TaxID=76259 RepID=UPI001CFA82E7|nr:sensor domain-containing diguanylate cyclase [Ferribacterium limneticum]UCV18551.1 diguanylate cyclase [Ferribacterium limneticum]
MMPWFGSSLKMRIAVVSVLLFLAGISLITFFATRILHDDMQEVLSKQQLTTVNYIARDIDAKVTLRLESLKRVALNMPEALFSNPPAMQQWLEDRKAIHTLFPIGLMVIPPDGGPTIGDAPRLKTRPKSFVDRDWFIGATTTRQPFISKPLIARATKEPALVIAIPIFDANQKLLGVLAGVTPLATPGFLDLILGTSPGKNGSYQLVSPQHHLVVLTSDAETAVTPMPNTGDDPVLDAAVNGLRGIKIIRNAANQDELVASAEVPRSNWLLVARQSTDDAFEPVSNTLRNTLLITALLSLPSIVVLFAVLSRLLKPIALLARELHEMAEGKRPMQPVATHTADEVADVAHSFNRLQDRLLEQEQRLAEMAHHDMLTGLPNRRLIDERLENELHRIQRNHLGLALLFLDLDGFKPVNDTHGHGIGDRVLGEIAHRLQAAVRDVDTVARLGGDEFLILLTDTEKPQKAAERVAQKCINALAEAIVINDLQIHVGVSIGIAVCAGEQAGTTTVKQLVSQADSAMYQAKAEGRNRYVLQASATPSTDS